MSIATDVSRIKGNVTAALAAIADKGVSVPDGSTSDALAELIASIEAGGGGKVTCGTITPLESIQYIEHSLGVVPKAFIWIVTFNNTMSGRTMGSTASVFSDEKAYSTNDLNIRNNYYGRMVCFVIGEYIYSLSFAKSTDWGFFTRGSINTRPIAAVLDETKFMSKIYEVDEEGFLLPFSNSGNITINWFAIGGD